MNNRGQMVVELSFIFPIMIVVAVVMVNALSFAGECARFDREYRNAVRAQASTPSLSSGVPQISIELLENESMTSSSTESGELVEYRGTLFWQPTLFGMGLKDSVFGVSLFQLQHTCDLVVNPHQSGDIL